MKRENKRGDSTWGMEYLLKAGIVVAFLIIMIGGVYLVISGKMSNFIDYIKYLVRFGR